MADDEVQEQVAGDVAMCGVGITKRSPNPEKGSYKEKKTKKRKTPADREPQAVKRRKTKLVTWRLSQDLVDYLWTREAMGYLATEIPRPTLISVPEGLFDQKLKEEIAAEFNENKESDAYVLYQYRTKGYADIQEEVTDNEDI